MIDRTLSTRPRANPKHGAWWDEPGDLDVWRVRAAEDMHADFGRGPPGELVRGIVWLNRARLADRARDFVAAHMLIRRALRSYPDIAEHAKVTAGAADSFARAAERERVIELPAVPATYEESTLWWRAAFYNSVGGGFG